MNIFLDVIGCRLNQSEVEGYANVLRALGHQIVSDPSEADIAIVNTCAVTVKAASDSRKQLRRAGRKGAAQVVATGCWATLHPETASSLEGVTNVYSNQQKDNLIADLLKVEANIIDRLQLVREPVAGERARTRAFIKVQEGCDNHCTYCLTRLARGRSQSRRLDLVQKDIQAALAGGAKEVVLTGVQLGAWGRDLPQTLGLGDLITHVLDYQELQRIRLSSIEPWDFDPAWLSLWSDSRLCRHLHIPLQSGCDRILKKMGRPISTKDYAGLITQIRTAIPEISLTTDIITGFPGETEEEFKMTQTFAVDMSYAGSHVFTYSPRPGTAANKMDSSVPTQVAKQRNAELRETLKQLSQKFRDEFIGQKVSVLWETSEKLKSDGWQLSGLTDHYIRVYSESSEDLWNEITKVSLLSQHLTRDALVGEVII